MVVAEQQFGFHARQGLVVDLFVGCVDAAVTGVAAEVDLRLGVKHASRQAHAVERGRLLGLGHAARGGAQQDGGLQGLDGDRVQGRAGSTRDVAGHRFSDE
ncbi:MAG TPA: hypothetical protein DDX04_15525 [Massilia sp.]|nr:hypothetical protein [Massilia sp.]